MSTLRAHLEERRNEFTTRCTACGECFTACPVAPWAGLAGRPAAPITAGVRNLLEGGERNDEAIRWAASCTLCGVCIPHCPERLNPRTMLHLAKAEVGLEGATAQGFFAFMSQGIRLLAGLQLDQIEFRRLTSPFGWGTSPAEAVLYYGCNVLRTPDILLTAIDILYRLGLRFGVLGGPANCCGIVHYRSGDLARAENIERSTYERMSAFSPKTVLLWCSNCEMQFLETGFRSRWNPPFALQHYARFLADRVEDLKPLLVNPVAKRAVVHEHGGGRTNLGPDVRRILRAVPALELLEVTVPEVEWGYGCGIGSLGLVPAAQRAVHETFLDAAESAGAELVVTLTHDGQMVLCEEEARRPFQVRNFVSIVGEAMGIRREDLYKLYTLAGGADAVIAAARKFLERNRIDPGSAHRSVEQHLEWGKRRRHVPAQHS